MSASTITLTATTIQVDLDQIASQFAVVVKELEKRINGLESSIQEKDNKIEQLSNLLAVDSKIIAEHEKRIKLLEEQMREGEFDTDHDEVEETEASSHNSQFIDVESTEHDATSNNNNNNTPRKRKHAYSQPTQVVLLPPLHTLSGNSGSSLPPQLAQLISPNHHHQQQQQQQQLSQFRIQQVSPQTVQKITQLKDDPNFSEWQRTNRKFDEELMKVALFLFEHYTDPAAKIIGTTIAKKNAGVRMGRSIVSSFIKFLKVNNYTPNKEAHMPRQRKYDPVRSAADGSPPAPDIPTSQPTADLTPTATELAHALAQHATAHEQHLPHDQLSEQQLPFHYVATAASQQPFAS